MDRQVNTIQITGIAGTSAGWLVSHLDAINVYLQTLSLVVGIALGAWALYSKIKQACEKA